MKHTCSFAIKALLLTALCATTLTSCIMRKEDPGKEVKKTIPVTPFENIDVNGNASVYLQQGDSFKVVMVGMENEIKRTEVSCKDGILFIDEAGNGETGGYQKMTFDYHFNHTKVYVTMPRLRKLEQMGNSDIEMQKPFTGDSILFEIQGNASMDIAGLKADYLGIRILGNASADLRNLTVETMLLGIQGNASVNADMKDAGNVSVGIEGNASVELTGTTRVRPSIDITGNGSVSNNTTRSKAPASAKVK